MQKGHNVSINADKDIQGLKQQILPTERQKGAVLFHQDNAIYRTSHYQMYYILFNVLFTHYAKCLGTVLYKFVQIISG